jgi:predicted HicB family RNase H-like nuclease
MAEAGAIDPRAYTITVRHVVVDGEALFRATVGELPDVAEFAESWEEAYGLAVDTIVGLREAAEKQQRPFPEPFAEEEEYSGRVTFRMPKSLHRRTAEHAKAEGVSLNMFLVTVIAERVGNIISKHHTATEDILFFRTANIGVLASEFGTPPDKLRATSVSSAGTFITAIDLGANVSIGSAARPPAARWLPFPSKPDLFND